VQSSLAFARTPESSESPISSEEVRATMEGRPPTRFVKTPEFWSPSERKVKTPVKDLPLHDLLTFNF